VYGNRFSSAAHAKYEFQVGDAVEGVGHGVEDPRLETADIYKASKLRFSRGVPESISAPPWHGVPPPLPVYRVRGHRRLAATTYDAKCQSCIWGCAMPVEIIIDNWNPDRRRYRTKTFCYGPLSCPVYKRDPLERSLAATGWPTKNRTGLIRMKPPTALPTSKRSLR
jgi:hypothetical protein